MSALYQKRKPIHTTDNNTTWETQGKSTRMKHLSLHGRNVVKRDFLLVYANQFSMVVKPKAGHIGQWFDKKEKGKKNKNKDGGDKECLKHPYDLPSF